MNKTLSASPMTRRAFLVSCSALSCVACGWETPAAPTRDQLLAQAPVRITDPQNSAVLLTPDILVRGTFAPSTLTDDIWLIVWPAEAGGKGYHQSPNAAVGEPCVVDRQNQRWSVPTGLGGPPQAYEISVHTADAAASRAMRDFLIEWARTGIFVGLSREQLPVGLVERHRIAITRR